MVPNLRDIQLLIATPSRGRVHIDYTGSIWRLGMLLNDKLGGIGFMSSKARTCPEARTELAHDFTMHTPATHVLCVDGDIEFPPELVIKLLELDLPIVGCTYASREDFPGPAGINLDLLPDADLTPVNGCIKVGSMGMGFTLIKREVIAEMNEHYSSELIYSKVSIEGRGVRSMEWTAMTALFHEPIRDGAWTGEDVIFFRRWRELGPGHDVWLYLDAPLVHYVEVAKEYNAADHLEELQEWSRTRARFWPIGTEPMEPLDWHPEILGWSVDILPFYRRVVAELPVRAKCVEVGVFRGRSLGWLGSELARQGKGEAHIWGFDPGVAWSVDVISPAGLPTKERLPASRPELLHNLARLKRDFGSVQVDTYAETSVEGAKRFEDQSLELVFIDGRHEKPYAAEDIRVWLPKVKPGGLISGHDYEPGNPGVIAAVDEAFGDRVQVDDTVWSVRV